jgi:hypothetical protein
MGASEAHPSLQDFQLCFAFLFFDFIGMTRVVSDFIFPPSWRPVIYRREEMRGMVYATDK